MEYLEEDVNRCRNEYCYFYINKFLTSYFAFIIYSTFEVHDRIHSNSDNFFENSILSCHKFNLNIDKNITNYKLHRAQGLINNFNYIFKSHETKVIATNTALVYTLGNTDKLSNKLSSNYKFVEFCTMCF